MANGGGAGPKLAPVAPPSPVVVDNEANLNSVEAIYVRNANKSYGVGKRRTVILDNLDMNVKKGSIYGLLGASGCGKTTLLSCIVGRRSFDSGEVMVFGGEPGTIESGIPGRRVGYMPQELALYGEFSIKETLEYFGRIYQLPSAFVKSQMEFLFKLLDLPPPHRSVKTLSGGQQRRVSFAVALFHEPDLFILDEPTVGVDPVLRKSIWNHLVRLSKNHGKTVIITTHYIEEARQADAIGLMRSGRLLAEESPDALLLRHNMTSLEDVFLTLCRKDGNQSNEDDGESNANRSSMRHRQRKPAAVTNGKNPASGFHQGVDNPAFAQNFNRPDALPGDDDKDASNYDHKSAQPTIYWKNNKSILPEEEDGIVGLTFSPSGDNLTSFNMEQQKHINDMNALNNQRHSDDPHESKDSSLYNMKHGNHGGSSSSSNNGDTNSSCGSTATTRLPGKRRSRTFALSVPSPHRTLALIRKNFMQTFRNIGVFMFIFLLPAVQAVLFCLAIGRDPTFLKVAVVNEELDIEAGRVCNYTTECKYYMYSCRYLRALDNTTVVQVPFDDHEKALEATRMGEVWGVVHFHKDFTDELMVRQSDGNYAENETIENSRIGISLDWSNQQISLTLQRSFIDAFDDFSKDLLNACSYNPGAGSLPVTFLDPVYGKKNPSFTEFMAPGIILTIVYFIAVALTAAVFINERKQGLLDRSLVAGVTTTEIMIAHLVNQFTVLMGQTALVFIFMILVFQIPCVGSLSLAIFITLLQGMCGMSYGFVVSSLCDQETSAIHLSLGSFYPNLLLSGVLWPMEGMPIYLRYISYVLPQTYAVESLRNIFARGWGIEREEVYWGVVISFAWIFALISVSLFIIRVRKYTG